MLCCVCGVLGPLAPVHRCVRSVLCLACAVSWATWPLLAVVLARCVVLRLRCPGPLGPCSLLCSLHALCCVWVSWVTWLLCSGVPARSVVLRVSCPGPLVSCSPVRTLCVLCCVRGVLGHLAPVHRCARSMRCLACSVSCANSLVFIGVHARCAVLRVRCPGPPGSCSPVSPHGAWCCVCGVLGHLAPVRRCARSVRCVVCAVSWATWLLCTGVRAGCAVLRVRCPEQVGSCAQMCPLGVLCCVCGVLGHLAPVHLCAGSVCCAVCAVSWATWLLFTGVSARCVVLRVPCHGPLGHCWPLCSLDALYCVCGVLGNLGPVHCCARSMPCVAYGCPGSLGSCAPVCPLGLLCCVCGVLGHLSPVHRCARSVCCAVCAVSWANWPLFTDVPAPCAVLRVRCLAPIR